MTRATAKVAKPLLMVVGIPVVLLWFVFEFIRKTLVGRLPQKGKSVLITGCDTGIGKEAAETLAAEGCVVFAGCFSPEGMEGFKENEGVVPFRLDVTSDKSVADANVLIQKELNRRKLKLWGLVNNAGIADNFYAEFMNIEDYQRSAEVNYFGQVRLCSSFLPLLKKADGRIVNIVSVAGLLPFASASAYCGSKFAAQGFTQSLRLELLNTHPKMSVSTVNPGPVKTSMGNADNLRRTAQRYWDKGSASQKEHLGGQVWLDNHNKNIDELFATGDAPSAVVDAIRDGLFSKYPLATYLVGSFPKMLLPILRFMPTQALLFDPLEISDTFPNPSKKQQ